MPEEIPELIVKSSTFKTATISIKNIFSKRDFNIPNFNYMISESLHELEVSMWKLVLKKERTFDKTYLPRTWKDHFKKRYRYKWWMRWWIKRKPIKHLKIKRITVFPDVQIPKINGFKNNYSFYEAKRDET